MDFPEFDVQGHRGCRGLMPENSIPGFIKALELGVNTLEMDVVISKDRKVVVSHEPYFSSEICMGLEGEGNRANLFEMNYEEIRKVDCGSKMVDRFPMQEKVPVSKPLLSEVVKAVEDWCAQHGQPTIWYNIEIKSRPEWDGVFHPEPANYVAQVLAEVQTLGIEKRTVIQSFDIRSLKETRRQNPVIPLALLEESSGDWEKALQDLGFQPEIISPNYMILKKGMVAGLQKKGIRVIPWTVNSVIDMDDLLDQGVDGIITDYPDRLIELLAARSERSNKVELQKDTN